jgi:DNA-binding HxlR family transcriptional regulator
MLTQQLRELERDGLVRREVFDAIPPKVEYSLTELGETLKPVLFHITSWGYAYAEHSPRNGEIAFKSA